MSKLIKNIFSITNENYHKVIRIVGIKFKLKSQINKLIIANDYLRHELENVNSQLNQLKDQVSFVREKQCINFVYTDESNESITMTEEITSPNHFNYNNIEIFPFCHIQKGVNIGKYSYIHSFSEIDLGVTIGRYCSISNNVLIGATMHQQNWASTSPFVYDPISNPDSTRKNWLIYKPTEIGNDVWIGSHVVVKTGVKIGHGAIIGSGAIVTKDIPPYAIAVGVPAKIIKFRFSDEIINKLLSLQWWNLPKEQIIDLPFDNIEHFIKELEK